MHAEHDFRSDGGELGCAICGHERIVVEADGDVTCPGCDQTYSLVVREEFTLLEADGWTARISFGIPDGLADAPN